MKCVIVFYRDSNCDFIKEKAFDGKSCEQLSADWAEALEMEHYSISCENVSELFLKLSKICEESASDTLIFSYQDLPFLDLELTRKLLKFHSDYSAEYTFADGYPYGFAPEILNAGTLKVLYELSISKFQEEGKKELSRTAVYDFIKQDINSFEVETLISEEDWRLFRFDFSCAKKENFIACKELFKKIDKKNLSVEQICKIAATSPEILKTVPAFYNIQITDYSGSLCLYSPYEKCYQKKYGIAANKAIKLMKFEDFSGLVDRISAFSQRAVLGLSAWGEALYHPELLKFIEKVLSYEGLSVIIESDGLGVTDKFCSELEKIVNSAKKRTNGWQKLMFLVKMDAFSDSVYKKIHGTDAVLEKSLEAVKKLAQVIPHCVYPQFVRMNENEEELEKFFRYWNEKTNSSQGEFIIQKYDDFAKLLPECKPADLSPVERNVCWHLRRDMTILTDGSVPFCREYVLDGIIGNVFKESLEEIWKKTDSVLIEQMNGEYKNKCKDCDEYYTFNF